LRARFIQKYPPAAIANSAMMNGITHTPAP
jgi:hypothetical protein